MPSETSFLPFREPDHLKALAPDVAIASGDRH